jgi:ABC transport system ATP-binding/permease protein
VTTADEDVAAVSRTMPGDTHEVVASCAGTPLGGATAPRLEITLTLGGRTRRRVLGRYRAFLIGRDLDNDLRVNDPAVSRHHVILQPSLAGWELISRSRNGILVNDRPAESHHITGPTVVTLGQYLNAPQVVITPLLLAPPAAGLPTGTGRHRAASEVGYLGTTTADHER